MEAADERDRVRRPWLPACLAAHGLNVEEASGLSYVVVEEIVESVATLRVYPWPAADGHGRLRFAPQLTEVAVGYPLLRTQLYRGWLSRNPRIGDVFAVRVDAAALDHMGDEPEVRALGRILLGPVYDLSAEARTVAKLALYAVRSDVFTATEAQRNRLAQRAVRNERPAGRRPPVQAVADDAGAAEDER